MCIHYIAGSFLPNTSAARVSAFDGIFRRRLLGFFHLKPPLLQVVFACPIYIKHNKPPYIRSNALLTLLAVLAAATAIAGHAFPGPVAPGIMALDHNFAFWISDGAQYINVLLDSTTSCSWLIGYDMAREGSSTYQCQYFTPTKDTTLTPNITYGFCEYHATVDQGVKGYLREMFPMPNNVYRIYLGLGSQLLSQWSGAQSITIYAPDMFALLGTKGQNEKLFATAIFGVVKFVASIMCALFLVDVIGRKRSLTIGITLQAVSMCYVAAFLTSVPNINENTVFSPAQKAASTAGIVMIYISGFGWAMGWNSIQYLLNAEIYPLRIRAISSSIVMCFHFVNQYGNSRAVPPMLLPTSSGGLSPNGTFWLFTVITIIGGLWAWVFIPETAGLSLEQMDYLFKLKWYRIGIFGRKDAERQVVEEVARWANVVEGKIEEMQVERVEDAGAARRV